MDIVDDRRAESKENVHAGLRTYKRRPRILPQWMTEMKWERVIAMKKTSKETPNETSQQTAGQIRRGRGQGPGRKWGHTCNAVLKRGRLLMYVFGGIGSTDCQTNDIQVFDVAKKVWISPKIRGRPPWPRHNHTATTVGHKIFVFGGISGKYPLKDVHIFDTNTNTWISLVTTGQVPCGREGHSAALLGKGLFVFGGCGRSRLLREEMVMSDLYILDTKNLTWTAAPFSGTPPSPRVGHTCSSYKSNFIVLNGAGSMSSLADVYILDANTLVWKELKAAGEPLPVRSDQTAVALGRYVLVFGGIDIHVNLHDDVHVLNVESGVWTKITTVGEAPSPRFGCVADCSERGEAVLFVGGCNDDQKAVEDMFLLNTGSLILD